MILQLARLYRGFAAIACGTRPCAFLNAADALARLALAASMTEATISFQSDL
jgi:hypothetical protein